MKKTFFITIPMLSSENLKEIRYKKDTTGELFSDPTHFPSIPMIEGNVTGLDEIKIIAIMTNDSTGRSKNNLELYKQELKALSELMGVNLTISDILVLPHEETKEKQVQLFKDISNFYESGTEIYMDVTYGTKITSIGLFSSLVYADKIKNCTIKSIIYGKYPHDDSGIGELYDIIHLYNLSMLVHSTEYMPEHEAMKLINSLWG